MNLGDFVNYASLHAILTLEAILMEGDSCSPKSWAAGAGFSVASGKWLTLGIIFSYVKWKWEYISHSTQERIKTDAARENTRVFWRLMVVFRMAVLLSPKSHISFQTHSNSRTFTQFFLSFQAQVSPASTNKSFTVCTTEAILNYEPFTFIISLFYYLIAYLCIIIYPGRIKTPGWYTLCVYVFVGNILLFKDGAKHIIRLISTS